jgi:tetratricopeptide (TPR) repeat protein
MTLCYQHLAAMLIAAGDPRQAHYYARQGVKLCKGMRDSAAVEAELRYSLGLIHRAREEHAEAIVSLTQAQVLALQEGNVSLAARALCTTGDIYRIIGDYMNAVEVLSEGVRLSEEIGDRKAIGAAYNNIAIVYCDVFDWERGLEMYGRSHEAYKSAGDRLGEAIALANIGYTFKMMGAFAKGVEPLLQALSITEELNDREHQARFRVSLAQVYSHLDQFDLALDHAYRALEFFGTRKNSVSCAQVLFVIGLTFARLDRLDEALEYLYKALEALGSASAPTLEHGICEWIAMTYEERKEPDLALEFYKRCTRLRFQIDSMKTQRALVMAEVKAKTERTMVENEQYRQQVKRLEGEVEQLEGEVEQLEGEVEQKAHVLTTMELRLARKDELIGDLKKKILDAGKSRNPNARKLLETLVDLLRSDEGDDTGWEAFERRFQEMHPGLLHELSQRYPSLTPMELRVCSLLRMNLISKDIAGILNTSVHTVNTHRRNLRAKLGLDSKTNLTALLMSMGEAKRGRGSA